MTKGQEDPCSSPAAAAEVVQVYLRNHVGGNVIVYEKRLFQEYTEHDRTTNIISIYFPLCQSAWYRKII